MRVDPAGPVCEWAGGLGGWTKGERLFPHFHALRGHAGQPGPRAENRERGFRSQQHVRHRLCASQRVFLIDRREFALPSAAHRRGCARRVFWPWHRPHNTATFRGGSRGVPYFPMTATAVDQHYRRKFLFYSEFQSRCRHARWPWKGPEFGVVWSLREWHINATKHCHLLPLFPSRLACSLLSSARSTAVPAPIASFIAWCGVADCRAGCATPTQGSHGLA